MTEAERQAAVMRDLGRGETRIFRNSVGQGWTGNTGARGPGLVRLEPGDVVIRNARPVRFGLMPASGDLIGWRSQIVTPDLVGVRIARFLSIEMKSATGRPGEGQREWAAAVQAAGGLAGFARTVEQARLIAGLPIGGES